MKCCEKCFADPILVKHVKKRGHSGACDYCGARRVKAVLPYELCDLFRPLIDLFEPLEEGKHSVAGTTSLAQCVEDRTGWIIFNESLRDHVRCALLDEIRDYFPKSPDADGYPSSEPWAMKDDSIFHSSQEEIWEQFTESIKWKRRYIPENLGLMTNPKEWLPQYLHELSDFVLPKTTYYRARLGGVQEANEITKPFPAHEMGAPPKYRATPGRANPAGIPYLYVAEKEITAVSEIRPFLGARVTIARLKPVQPLQVIDLSRVPDIVSPFEHPDLRIEIEKNALLHILNRELSKPVSPSIADIEYIPTQYLAEVILHLRYDGIRYKSAMNEGGFNIVFFDHTKLNVIETTRLVTVTATSIEYAPKQGK
jgi:hypothetical protein